MPDPALGILLVHVGTHLGSAGGDLGSPLTSRLRGSRERGPEASGGVLSSQVSPCPNLGWGEFICFPVSWEFEGRIIGPPKLKS